jgi:hypothetical protein
VHSTVVVPAGFAPALAVKEAIVSFARDSFEIFFMRLLDRSAKGRGKFLTSDSC